MLALPRVAGVDDAGRGCVIGPLAVAGVLVDEEGLRCLCELGVRDSKALSPAKRAELAAGIKRVALAWKVVLVPPREIDRAVACGGLNKLEAKVIAAIIDELCPEVAYVDASDVLALRFASTVCSFMARGRQVRVIAEHKADAKYPVVSAASILAKVARDEAIKAIKEEVGVDFGSGYPTDPRTLAFLRECLAENPLSPPEFVRCSWRTVRELLSSLRTQPLDRWRGE